MKEHWLKAKEWWASLALREKQALAIGAVSLFIFIVYQGIWSPLVDQATSMRKRIVAQQKTVVWMQAADKALQKAEGEKSERKQSTSPVVLLAVMQKQINQAGLDAALTQLKQGANETVEMHFQKVEFDKLITLLMHTIKTQRVSLAQLSASAEGSPGIVNADIMLKLG